MASCKKNIPAFGKTDNGCVRRRNEDAFRCDAERGIFAVADGLGGLACGDLASKTAIDALAKILAEPDTRNLADWLFVFDRINAAVLAAVPADKSGAITGGTTLTVAQLVSENQLRIGHVGDSGVFLFSKSGEARQLTRDHTVARAHIDTYGEQIIPRLTEREKNTLTQCLGQTDPLEVETLDIALSAGDRLLLYTDGVTKVWMPEELGKIVSSALTPADAVNEIIAGGIARGAPDNITAIAVFCAGSTM